MSKESEKIEGESPSARDRIITLKTLPKEAGRKSRIYRVDKERIVIGSLLSADVRVTGSDVSPIHAVIEVTYDKKRQLIRSAIFDLASESGVFVNGKKVIHGNLHPEDEITIGRHSFCFSIVDKEESTRDQITRQAGNQTLFINKSEDLTALNLVGEREVIEIFDFRPTLKRALEVVMSWHGAILEVSHFVTTDVVTIGNSRKNHFAIPLPSKISQFPLVKRIGDSFVLNLDRSMKGVMQKSGELKSLEQMSQSASTASGGHEVLIGDRDFVKVSIQDIDFYLCYTEAPPRLKRRRLFDRDPLFLRVFFLSMMMTAVALYGLFKVKLSPSIEPDQIPERIATILYQPEKFMQPPKPEPKKAEPVPLPEAPAKARPEAPKPEKLKLQPVVPPEKKPIPKVIEKVTSVVKPHAKPAVLGKAPTRTGQPLAQEGAGTRAQGASGTRGEPKRPAAPQSVDALSRPSPQAGDSGAQGASQVADDGNIDILKGATGRIQNLFGNSGARLGKGSENLKGFGTFTSDGSGGLALSGKGRGGGGDAQTTLGGLGQAGAGMGRVGTGKGAAGRGTGILGSQVRVSIQANGPEETIVMGAIDRNAVAEAIYAHKDEFRLCYEREINAEHPNLSGQVSTSFVIGSSGRVMQAGIESSSLGNANTERCVITVLKRIDFPMPRGGGVVEVHFPFKFNSAGRGE